MLLRLLQSTLFLTASLLPGPVSAGSRLWTVTTQGCAIPNRDTPFWQPEGNTCVLLGSWIDFYVSNGVKYRTLCCKAYMYEPRNDTSPLGWNCVYSPSKLDDLNSEDACFKDSMPVGGCIKVTQELVYNHQPGPVRGSCSYSPTEKACGNGADVCTRCERLKGTKGWCHHVPNDKYSTYCLDAKGCTNTEWANP